MIGNWKDCRPFLSHYKALKSHFKVTFESKEKLYSYDLAQWKIVDIDDEVRPLASSDFEQWHKLRNLFMEEEGFSTQGDEESHRKNFISKTENQHWWGLFRKRQLLSIAAYNAKYKDLAQIGGVFTLQEHRRNGYSRFCMNRLMNDSVHLHKLKRLILFTGENNQSARELYESMGFKDIGHFGLIFGTVHSEVNVC